MAKTIYLFLLAFTAVSIADAQTSSNAAKEHKIASKLIEKAEFENVQKSVVAMLNLSRGKEIDSVEKESSIKDTVLAQQHQVLLKTFFLKRTIFPVLLMTYGGFSVENPHIRGFNSSWKNELLKMKIGKNHADDYTQFAPMVIVYGLNFTGVKGNNGVGDAALVSITSFLVSTAIVRPLKQLTVVRRPDGSNDHSFPSGHTSTAFVSAQFMYREYKGKNSLLSLMGYPFAIYTALYRTVNNKHWFGDVMAGAGIGIISTELAYYLLPYMKNIIKNISKSDAMAYPFYQNNTYGLGIQVKL